MLISNHSIRTVCFVFGGGREGGREEGGESYTEEDGCQYQTTLQGQLALF